MAGLVSIKIGDFLFNNLFPLYNFIYPIFKKRQDKDEIALLKKYINPGDTVLDIGANIGFYSRIISGLVGEKGQVYSFEPDITNFKYLQQNVGHLKNVKLHNKAVGQETGEITLYKSTMLNVDHRTYPTAGSGESYPIEVLALDDYLAGKKIDFIKIDIQGYEYFAFAGMKKILTENENIKILTEFYPNGIKASGVDLNAFFELLWGFGFKSFSFESDKKIPFGKEDIEKNGSSKDPNFFTDVFFTKD